MKTHLQLEPLPFHDMLCATLRDLEPGLWKWFSSDRVTQQYAEEVRLQLLRATYRLPRESHSRAYALADETRTALAIDAPVTLYQIQEDGPMNAALVFVPEDVHLVFRGPIETKLTETELRALLGHELAHHKLWTAKNGEYRVADSLIDYVASNGGSSSHQNSSIRHSRWTEVYADRGGFLACDDLNAAIATLVKVATGLDRVDGAAYLAQAAEALSKDAKSEGVTHPETFIRAFALQSWVSGGDFDEVVRLVEGPVEIDALDLVQQRHMTATTRTLLQSILAPTWMQTDAMLSHARRFFPDFRPNDQHPEPTDFSRETESVAEYVAYVLIDFALADHDIEDVALAHVAALSSALGVKSAFAKLAKKELKLTLGTLAELETQGIRLATEPPPALTSEGAP